MAWRRIRTTSLVLLFLVMAGRESYAVQELRYGSASKADPILYLPVLAAEEKGFWAENGLAVKFFPFGGATPMYKALVAGEVRMGNASVASFLHAAAAGLPVTMVGELFPHTIFYLWVKADNPRRRPEELKGAKIGVSSFGSVSHIYSQAIAKALGLEKEVRIVAAGGVAEYVAALKGGAVDVIPGAFATLELEARGEIRPLVRVADYLPEDWSEYGVVAEKRLGRENPDMVRNALKAIVQGMNFISQNRQWTIDRMKSFQRYSDKGASRAYDLLKFTRGGKINEKGLKNAVEFLSAHGLFRKEKLPSAGELYQPDFAPGG